MMKAVVNKNGIIHSLHSNLNLINIEKYKMYTNRIINTCVCVSNWSVVDMNTSSGSLQVLAYGIGQGNCQ